MIEIRLISWEKYKNAQNCLIYNERMPKYRNVRTKVLNIFGVRSTVTVEKTNAFLIGMLSVSSFEFVSNLKCRSIIEFV